MKQIKKNRSLILFIVLCIGTAPVHTNPNPTSRNSPTAEQLTPSTVIISSLMFQMTQLLSTIESYLVGFQKKALLDANNNLESIAINTDISAEKLCGLLNIAAYESSYTGGLPLFNLGGPHHNNTDCSGNILSPVVINWNYPLLITDSDPTFQNVNVVKFQQDIVYQPTSNTCINPFTMAGCNSTTINAYAAIFVAKDNMTIDLSGFTLTLNDSLLTPAYDFATCPASSDCMTAPACITQVHGIYIMPGVKNTQIISSRYENSSTHSTISNFTGYGIFIAGATGAGNQVNNVHIEDIHINENFGGLMAEYATDLEILHVKANSNCSFDSVYGMQFNNVSDLSIIESQANNNTSCGDVWGIYLNNTINAKLRNVQASQNSSTYNGSAYGIHVAGTSTDNTLEHSTITNNICANFASVSAYGLLLDAGTSNNIIENNTILNNQIQTGTPITLNPPTAYGIEVNGSNYNIINKNKVGLNSTIGIYDTAQTAPNGSTSFFTANISFFNSNASPNLNFSIFFNSGSSTTLTALVPTVLHAPSLKGINTANITTDNLDIQKMQ